MKLVSIKQITGIIHLCSGLHIGAGNDTIEIGGMDQPVIKDPVSGAPYIPGSSIKGKIRSLLETTVFLKNKDTEEAVKKGQPCACGKPTCPACTIFGSHGNLTEGKAGPGPTRLIVRDAQLTDSFMKLFNDCQLPMENKYENSIDRVSGVAKNPRQLERVPAGTEFKLDIVFREYEEDSKNFGNPMVLLNHICTGMRLLELDALGGGGSRGNGQIKFKDLQLVEHIGNTKGEPQPFALPEIGNDAFPESALKE